MTYDSDTFDELARIEQAEVAAATDSVPLQAHIAATSEDAATLIALARNLRLHPSVQTILANSEHGLSLLDRGDLLSSAHAQLLARHDLAYYPARIIMEENTPAVQAMILANAANPTIRQAASKSNVLQNRTLI